jgi:hypothetical protein
MKRTIFKTLAKFNKKFLPAYSKKDFDLAKASTLQKAVIGYRYWVTKNSLED